MIRNSFILNAVNLFIFLALILNSPAIFANVAAPILTGNLSGEPGGFEKILIKSENLTLDFRPLGEKSSGAKVSIEAVYEIENTGAETPLELIFGLGRADVSDFAFFLDDAQIVPESNSAQAFSKNWKNPKKTIWQNKKEVSYAPNNSLSDVQVNLKIPPGSHKIKIIYKAEPTKNNAYAPVLLYQFAYILTPAKSWTGFNSLDVNVKIPAGWQIVADPEFEQNGEILTKHFETISADALTFTLGKPMPTGYYLLKSFLTFLFIFSLFGLPLIMIFLLIKSARKKNYIQPAGGLLWSLLWAGLTLASGFGAMFLADHFYKTVGNNDFTDVFLVFFLFILCFVIFVLGSAIWAITAVLINNKRRAE